MSFTLSEKVTDLSREWWKNVDSQRVKESSIIWQKKSTLKSIGKVDSQRVKYNLAEKSTLKSIHSK